MTNNERLPPVFETEQQRDRRELHRDLVWCAIIFLAIAVMAAATKALP